VKLRQFEFSKQTRKDNDFVDFANDLTQLINNSRYQMRVVTTVPTHIGDEGEFLLYISGTIRRFYFYDSTNNTWHFSQWGTSGFSQTTIVSTIQLIDQGDDISTAIVYTPSSAGLYRVNVYMICTTAGTGTLSATIGWSDISGAKTITPTSSVNLNSTANGALGTSFLSCEPVAITYATAIAGKAGSPKYAIYISLEALF